MIDEWDFTLDKYTALCDTIVSSGYKTLTLREYLQLQDIPDKVIIMRHDVDDNIRFVGPVAQIEYLHGIKSTYYFRLRESVYIPEKIDPLIVFGHDVGYHYETVDTAKGDINEAVRIFAQNLAQFRERYDVKTVCMHGNPLSPYDNKKIWDVATLGQFDLIGEPYLSLDYTKFAYFSDSGRSWSNENKVKDVVRSVRGNDGIEVTDDLMRAIKEETYPYMSILVHPTRWRGTLVDYVNEYLYDGLVNMAKAWVLKFGPIQMRG